MSIRNLDKLFKPASVALIGASAREHSLGAIALQNLLMGSSQGGAGGYQGQIWPVNPKYDELRGVRCYHKLSQLPKAPDLALVCTPPASIPGIIQELGAMGTRAVVVMTAGMEVGGEYGKQRHLMLKAARPHVLRILGPNSMGLLVPKLGLNASFAHLGAASGKIAFVSQSGALVSGVLDWAHAHGVGFSKFVSLGGSADIDFGDLLDYLAGDIDTAAILLYMEDIQAARKFISAARAAARSKPVIVLKAGREAEGAAMAAWHTGALAGSDAVYDAAIRRAGMLRVYSAEELFDAVETLTHVRAQRGERLAVLCNGGGLGVMATDALVGSGGKLAELSPDTVIALEKALPRGWSHDNPVGLKGDAPAQRYVDAIKPLLDEPQADALLLLHAPTAMVSSTEIAEAVAPLVRSTSRTVLSCLLGGSAVAPARQILNRAGIPTYDTPEKAVHGFMQIVQYRRNQEMLMQVPAQLPLSDTPRRARVREIVALALAAGQTVLGECRSKEILAAYGIPVATTRMAADVEEALAVAADIGYPVALKIHSPDIAHKSDVGGVALDLDSPDILRSACAAMERRVRRMRPDALIDGFTVQQMARRPQSHELIVGVTTDAAFGPVILVGQGGISVEVTADHAIGLPPLNMVLARDMLSRTRVSKLLAGYRSQPPANIDAICYALIQVAELVADIGELAELDINPLLADANGVIALDARIRLQPGHADRLAIRPYPQELEEQVMWMDQPIVLRPIRPEDAPQHLDLFNALDPDDVRLRFFTAMRELPHSQLARLTQIDYDRAMAFIATRTGPDGEPETLGVVRAVADPDNITADFAIAVRSKLKAQGLGHILFEKLVHYFRSRGTEQLVGEAMARNKGMQRLVKSFGGSVTPSEEPGVVDLHISLRPPA